MKELHYFQTVHMEEDVGAIKDVLNQESVKIFGREEWQVHLDEVRKSWDKIRNYAMDLISNGVNPSKIKIYQDGLPNSDELLFSYEMTGVETPFNRDDILLNKIVKPAAENGSKNYKIIDELVQQGAVLEGVESFELLIKEHGSLSSIKDAKTGEGGLKHAALYRKAKKEMTEKRDKYIAKKINKSLTEGYTGLAFFGAGHSITDKLDKDIDVTLVEKFKDPISLKIIELAKGNYSSFTDIVEKG